MAQSFLAAHITTNATTVVKASSAVLHTITINTKGATGNIATLYNDPATTNNPLAVIDTTSNVGTLYFDIVLPLGLTIVTATGTAGDLTISYE